MTLRVYTHLFEEREQLAIDAMNGYLGRGISSEMASNEN